MKILPILGICKVNLSRPEKTLQTIIRGPLSPQNGTKVI